MKSYLTLTVFILLSSSASRACGGSFFKPFYEEDTNQVKPVVVPKGACTVCGAPIIIAKYLTTPKGTKTDVSQEDKSQSSKK